MAPTLASLLLLTATAAAGPGQVSPPLAVAPEPAAANTTAAQSSPPAPAPALAAVAPVPSPKLVVVVIVPGLQAAALGSPGDRLPDRGGLDLLRREGLELSTLDYPLLPRAAAADLALLASGAPARGHGLVDRSWYDRIEGRTVAALREADGSPTARRLRVPTLGDRLRRRWPGSIVLALAPDQETAALLAGRRGRAIAATAPSGRAPTDEALLTRARQLLSEERLGSDAQPDLLWVALRGLPRASVGKPGGAGAELRAVDRGLGQLAAGLEAVAGRNRSLLLVVGAPAPVPALTDGPLAGRIRQTLAGRAAGGPALLDLAGDGVALAPPAASDTAQDAATTRAAACALLAELPGVGACRPRPALAAPTSGAPSPLAAAEADALVASRSWDLLLLPPAAREPHGSAWLLAPGLRPTRAPAPSPAAGLAPTLAAWLGLDPLPDAPLPPLAAAAPPAAADPVALELVLLHTNDHHGQDLDHPGPGGKGRVGGLGMRAALVDAIRDEQRASAQRVLLLDAGDASTGPCPATRLLGRSSLEAMDRLGYEAMALGNHEFDQPLPTLLSELDRLSLPVLSATARRRSDGELLLPPVRRLSLAGRRVTVLGLTTVDTPATSTLGDDPRLRFDEAPPIVRRWVEQLRPESDLLILLSHQGLERDQALAREVPGIDLIVGGHSHDPLAEPVRTNGTLIVQAGCCGRFLGRADLLVDDAGVKLRDYALLPVPAAGDAPWPPSAEVEQPLQQLWQSETAACAAPVGRALARFERTPLAGPGTGSTLAHLAADAMRWRAKTDLALQNEGGLREDLPAGEVSLGHVQAVLPFANSIVRLELTGGELLQVLGSVAARRAGELGVLHVSGMSWAVVDGTPQQVIIGGEPLRADRSYTIATNSFLARGGDGYKLLAELGRRTDTGFDATAAVADFIRETGPVAPDSTPRVRRLPAGARPSVPPPRTP